MTHEPPPTRRNSKPKRASAVVKPADQVESKIIAAGTATAASVLLGPNDGAQNFFMRKFTMQQGGGMPKHTNTVEHEQYVLGGRARIEIGSDCYEVGVNDVVFIPAGVAHSYQVIDAPFEFLCLVPNQPDQIEVLESTC